MERWKPYAKNLKPLLNALDTDLLKPEDIAYINKQDVNEQFQQHNRI